MTTVCVGVCNVNYSMIGPALQPGGECEQQPEQQQQQRQQEQHKRRQPGLQQRLHKHQRREPDHG
jgi:hypothetical protein